MILYKDQPLTQIKPASKANTNSYSLYPLKEPRKKRKHTLQQPTETRDFSNRNKQAG